MRVVETKVVGWFGASAITFYPWVFIDPTLPGHYWKLLLKHEGVHIAQQESWYSRAWVFGLLAWYFLYLLVLPVGWNPWRRKWETEAYTFAEEAAPDVITNMLQHRPYYLWWIK